MQTKLHTHVWFICLFLWLYSNSYRYQKIFLSFYSHPARLSLSSQGISFFCFFFVFDPFQFQSTKIFVNVGWTALTKCPDRIREAGLKVVLVQQLLAVALLTLTNDLLQLPDCCGLWSIIVFFDNHWPRTRLICGQLCKSGGAADTIIVCTCAPFVDLLCGKQPLGNAGMAGCHCTMKHIVPIWFV